MPPLLRWLLRLGPMNPIAVRLVQGGSRRRRHMYIRAAFLGVLIIVLMYMLLTSVGPEALSPRQLALAAAQAFEYTAYLQIGLICVVAPVFMAGAIAQEANPRTWDILLTTPLSAAEIVLGNLFGRLIFILALMFSSLPLFALTQYFGGVPGRSIFLSYLIAACAALLVGAAAIALSVSRLVGRRAVFAFYVSVISYLAVTWGADAITARPGMVSVFTAINPFLALRALLNPTGYSVYEAGSTTGVFAPMLERPVWFWCMLSAGLSLVLMAVSTITVRIGGIAGAGGFGGRGGEGGKGKAGLLRRMLGYGAAGADTRSARHVWNNAIAWREAAARNATFGRSLARWSFIAAGALWAIGVVLYYHGGNLSTNTFRMVISYTVIGEMLVLTLVSLNMSATAVAKEREDGTLDILLTTPMTPKDYLAGKIRGMVAYLLPLLAVPVGTLLLAGMYVVLVTLGMPHPGGATGAPTSVMVSYRPIGAAGALFAPAVLPEGGIALALVGVPFTAFCCMIGLMWSVKSKGSIGSVIATVGIVAVIGGILGLCAYQAGANLPLLGPAIASWSPMIVIHAAVFPEDALAETIKQQDMLTARFSMFVGAMVTTALYMVVVYMLRATVVSNFDMTVRRLAGAA